MTNQEREGRKDSVVGIPILTAADAANGYGITSCAAGAGTGVFGNTSSTAKIREAGAKTEKIELLVLAVIPATPNNPPVSPYPRAARGGARSRGG